MAKDKEQTIIEAAIKLFAENGFDNTSTASISAAAGIGTGTLFKYYESKEELIVAAYLQSKLAMAADIKQGLNPAADFEDLLRHVWDRAIAWALERPEMHKFTSQVKSSRLCDAASSEKVEQEFFFLFIALKAAQDSGKIANIPVPLIQLSFSSFFDLAIEYAALPDVDAIEARNTVFNMMMKSLKP